LNSFPCPLRESAVLQLRKSLPEIYPLKEHPQFFFRQYHRLGGTLLPWPWEISPFKPLGPQAKAVPVSVQDFEYPFALPTEEKQVPAE